MFDRGKSQFYICIVPPLQQTCRLNSMQIITSLQYEQTDIVSLNPLEQIMSGIIS